MQISNPSPNCWQVDSNTALTQEEIDEVLKAHNDKRALVASGAVAGQPAGTIPPLEWDDELAEVAQRWANQCQFGHDDCPDVERFSVGQNVAWNWYTAGYNSNLSDMIESWYNEVKHFDGSQVSSYQGQRSPKIGHYTQLVWGDTTHVGCAVIKYLKDRRYNTLLVCDYGPGGNFIGEPVYRTT